MDSFPFDSKVTYQSDGTPVYDRAVDSEHLSNYFALLYTDGVFPNPSTNLQVTANGATNQVIVQPGSCNAQGKLAIENTQRTMALQAPDSVYDRIDSVVIRKNENSDYRNVDLYVLTGIAASNPIPPFLTRTSAIYELRIANIFRPKNTSTVTQARVTDTRLNTEECGLVTANPLKIDTTTIFNQYQSALDDYMEIVKAALDETTAGNLQNQIDALKNQTPYYGICNTSASVVAKTATLSGFKLVSGAKAVIKFTYGSTATSPTLNISSTGAKAIYYKGAAVPSGFITANAFVELVYDGTRYNIVGDLAQAKINELESMLSVTDITSSFSPSTDKISISKAYKYGKLVIVHGFLVAGYAQGWHTTETITTSYPPLTNASFIMGSQNSGDQTTGIKLDYRPSGTVYGTVSAALTGNNLFQLIYFTA